jgi:hypothetical protein
VQFSSVATTFSTFTAFCNFTGWADTALRLWKQNNPTDSLDAYTFKCVP